MNELRAGLMLCSQLVILGRYDLLADKYGVAVGYECNQLPTSLTDQLFALTLLLLWLVYREFWVLTFCMRLMIDMTHENRSSGNTIRYVRGSDNFARLTMSHWFQRARQICVFI